MGALGNLIPLVILFLFVGGFAWVGYQVSQMRSPQAHKGADPNLTPRSTFIRTN